MLLQGPEHIIYDKIIDFLTDSVINNHQYGFLTRSLSCPATPHFPKFSFTIPINATLPLMQSTLDFRRAFDKASHPELYFSSCEYLAIFGCSLKLICQTGTSVFLLMVFHPFFSQFYQAFHKEVSLDLLFFSFT